MKSNPDVKVEFNHIPDINKEMVVKARVAIKRSLEEIASNIESSGPYRDQVEATAKFTAIGGTVEVDPWWISFIELGSVTHSAHPFVEPTADRGFKELVLKIAAIAGSLR